MTDKVWIRLGVVILTAVLLVAGMHFAGQWTAPRDDIRIDSVVVADREDEVVRAVYVPSAVQTDPNNVAMTQVWP